MKKLIDVVLIIGFLLVDFLMFHDLLKTGEAHTMTEYLTGFLSILVIGLSIQSLFKNKINQ
ncbi:MAG: hypothetical protein JWM39_106 [Parcubacteria group bacterium]|nr:hypothetical protein [Parcubacteria group bacterium]